jgi:hypothetical protein
MESAAAAERVWDELRQALGRDDVVTLTLPGFGSPRPDGFEPTKDGYAPSAERGRVVRGRR